MKTKMNWKNILPNVVIVLIFIIASAIYFIPALQGKVVYAVDNINASSASQECIHNRENTGVDTWWTGSMFSGMPTYQIGGGGSTLSDKIIRPIRVVLGLANRNAFFIFLYYLIAFYLLMRAFNMGRWLSMAGSFAIALSSYFFIIIAASHLGKCYTLTWFTLVIVGFLLCFRQKYLWGAFVTMFFTYIGFYAHPQMGYYLCLFIAVLGCAELAQTIQNKAWKGFGLSLLVFAISFCVGLGAGSANFLANQEYSTQTMRGGHSDLTKSNDQENKTKGLDLDYATAWSYGKAETFTFLIPNFMGGASGYNVGEKSLLYEEMVKARVPRASAKQFCQNAPTYWGEKAFTSGPVYMGAIICFLFVLGLIIVPGPYKWALLIATVFSVLLAWGRNFMPLTHFFFNYFPMYNKFRAVESILVVAEIAMPLLGFMALKRITETEDKHIYFKPMCLAASITAGLCLFFALFGGIIDFTSTYDAQWKGQVGDFYDIILDQRAAMLKADAWRSFVFVALAFVLIWIYTKKHIKTFHLAIVLTILIVADMWPVNKRFLNEDNFISARERDKAFNMEDWEKEVLKDKSHYRILNLTANVFNDARSSYYCKSIGGYSAVKLRRYQDMIDVHLSNEVQQLMRCIYQTNGFQSACEADEAFPVLNMLNMKYAIVSIQGGQKLPIQNPYAMGNAWLVDEVQVVDNANQEIETLKHIDLHHVAVTDRQFASYVIPQSPREYNTDTVFLTEYTADHVDYQVQCATDRTVVFSEIYYPFGWKAYIDGQPVEHFRVNYVLRALNVPQGEHTIHFEFRPDSIRYGNIIAVCCLAIIMLTFLLALIQTRKKANVSN